MVRIWSAVASGWRAFRRWRHGRPFAAGILLFLSGVAILLPPYGTLRFGDFIIMMKTLGGTSALVLGGTLLVCAGAAWVRPRSRVLAGSAAVLLSLAALVTANLGGFLVGTLLGLLGGALCVAWTERPRPARGAAGVTGDVAAP
jgi:hypothetical protein